MDISSVNVLIDHFLESAQVTSGELNERRSILCELANRTLKSSIKSSPIDIDFILDEAKKQVILQTGSNRRAIELDQSVQKYLINKSYESQSQVINFLYRLSQARNNRDSNQKSVIDLIPRTEQVIAKLTKSFNISPKSADENDRNKTNSQCNDSENLASHTFQAAVKRANELLKQLDSVNEQDLLKDFIHVLRGHDGQFIVFDGSKYVCKSRVTLSGLTRGFVEQILFFANLSKSIKSRITKESSKAGRIREAFCKAVGGQLRMFEGQVDEFERQLFGYSTPTARLSLPELACRLGKWKLSLLLLDKLTVRLSDVRGGALLDELIPYLDYGANNSAKMTVTIYDQCAHPFIVMIDHWIRHGSIDDPYEEFFITETQADAEWWDKRFVIVKERIPKYLQGQGLVERIYIYGKTRSLLDKVASDNHPMDCDVLGGMDEMVESWEPIFKQHNQMVMAQMFGKLVDNLEAIKKYILLAEGDFAVSLMDLLCDALSKPANTLLRHNLVGMLEAAAARQTNMPHDRLMRLDVRLLDAANQKTLGWDVFCLDYRVDFPVNVVLSQEAMMEYAKTSHFLWSLKRVEYAVNNGWGRLTKSRRLFHSHLLIDYRRMQLLMSEMRTLIQQIIAGAYECIEQAWAELIGGLHERDIDVDSVVHRHRQYLNSIRANYLPWSNGHLRNKLGIICASVLRAESVCRHFVIHAAFAQERSNRERGVSSDKSGLHGVSEEKYQSFLANQLKNLTELRASFQSIARSFQTELDDFISTIQRESSNSPSAFNLLSLIDLSGYHGRRDGFDLRKYRSN